MAKGCVKSQQCHIMPYGISLNELQIMLLNHRHIKQHLQDVAGDQIDGQGDIKDIEGGDNTKGEMW